MNDNVKIRPMKPDDWPDVLEIYRQGIETGNSTFEQTLPSFEEWDKRHLNVCRLIVVSDNQISGWAALLPVSTRKVYSGVAEVSIYISEKLRGKKIGTKLLEKLIDESEKNGIWTLQASVFPENPESIKLNEKLGFRQVGYREKIGKMNGKWRNTILFERRSKNI
jgi:phosphinothricin acetyltransferase